MAAAAGIDVGHTSFAMAVHRGGGSSSAVDVVYSPSGAPTWPTDEVRAHDSHGSVSGGAGGGGLSSEGGAPGVRGRPEDARRAALRHLSDSIAAHGGGVCLPAEADGAPRFEAVVAIDAGADGAQRAQLREDVTAGGVKVLRLVNRPTLVAHQLAMRDVFGADERCVIVIVGGRTCSATVMSQDEGLYDVLSHVSESDGAGGDAMDDLVAADCARRFGQRLRDGAAHRLRRAVRQARHALSMPHTTTTAVTVEDAGSGDAPDLSLSLSRARLEHLIEPVCRNIVGVVQRALVAADTREGDIVRVGIAGGCAVSPRVRAAVRGVFSHAHESYDPEPATVAARGAASLAARLSRRACDPCLHALVTPMIPCSLGVEAEDGAMVAVLPRNTMVPVRKTKGALLRRENDGSVNVRVFEGERPVAAANREVACLVLEPQVETTDDSADHSVLVAMTFLVDADDVLTVTAEPTSDAGLRPTTWTSPLAEAGRLSEAEIAAMVEEAAAFRDRDAAEEAVLRHAEDIATLCADSEAREHLGAAAVAEMLASRAQAVHSMRDSNHAPPEDAHALAEQLAGRMAAASAALEGTEVHRRFFPPDISSIDADEPAVDAVGGAPGIPSIEEVD